MLLEGILQADTNDAQGAWVIAGGHRVDVEWPPGFEIAFVSPRPELLAPSGTVVAAVGDELRLGGGQHATFSACSVNGVSYR